jgi:metallo-beta-lactamase class B
MRRTIIAFRLAAASAFLLTLFANCCSAQQAPPCPECPIWNAAQSPFRIYGNTWYVGPHGLSAILIASDAGHILIDGGLPESAPQIAAHIRLLGFRVEDVKLILNTHVHFDHAGGIAELQRLSGARVAASEWSAAVLQKGGVAADDPQFGIIAPIRPVIRVETLRDGEVLRVGPLEVTAHLTPGHTPGGTSWTWKSCEKDRCLAFVYVDSLSPVSAEGFKFSSSPQLLQDFERTYSFLRSTPCDILLTTHPDASAFWDRLEARQRSASQNPPTADPMVDTAACRGLADRASAQLTKRLAEEKN